MRGEWDKRVRVVARHFPDAPGFAGGLRPVAGLNRRGVSSRHPQPELEVVRAAVQIFEIDRRAAAVVRQAFYA